MENNKGDQMTTENNTVKYYVGDLCYVMHDCWDEVCGVSNLDNEDWDYELEDGRKFFLFSTTFGDGQYNDFEGNPYSVDSGTIGAIKVDDIRDLEGLAKAKEMGLGHIHDFPDDFAWYDCSFNNGLINMYNVSIDTGSYDEEESESEEEDS